VSEIRIVNLTFGFGKRVLLDRVSFVVPEGSVFVLLGPSGCGKTTLFRLLAGFLRPDAGEIYLDGRCVSSPRHVAEPRTRRIGMVFQSLALWPHLSAAQHLRFAGAAGQCATLLEAVGLGGTPHRRPDRLSGGQKQRLAIGRALAGDPRILLLDEPFSNLDPPYRYEINELLRGVLERARRTVFLVTHHPREVAVPVTGYLLLEEGRIYGPRPLRELVEQSDSRYARLMRAYLDTGAGEDRREPPC
jgi:iron(III) transport system ATP-binding protein